MLVTVVLPGKTTVAPLSCDPASVVDEFPIGITMVNDESMVPLSVLAPCADVHVVGRMAVVVVGTETGETIVKGGALVLDAEGVVEATDEAAEDATTDDSGVLDGDGVGVVETLETRVTEETGITLVDVPPGRVLVTVMLVETSTVVWLQ